MTTVKALEMLREIGKETERTILAAMPGTIREISRNSGLSIHCVEKVVRRLRREESSLIVVCGTRPRPTRGGSPSMVFDAAGEGQVTRGLKVPVTQCHTAWIGGNHPCQQFNPWAQAAA